MNEPAVELVWPAREYLPGYVAALERGWSPNNLRPEAGFEELAQIRANPARFLEGLVVQRCGTRAGCCDSRKSRMRRHGHRPLRSSDWAWSSALSFSAGPGGEVARSRA